MKESSTNRGRLRALAFSLAALLILVTAVELLFAGINRLLGWDPDLEPVFTLEKINFQEVEHPLFCPGNTEAGPIFRPCRMVEELEIEMLARRDPELVDEARRFIEEGEWDLRFHRLELRNRLRYDEFARPKGPETFRIFVFGGSAAFGLGYSRQGTFSEFLERLLSWLQPGRDPEVINCSLVGMASEQVFEMALEVLADYDPDLLIVYSGNNEFYEIPGRIASSRFLSPGILGAHIWLSCHSRFYFFMKKTAETLISKYRPETEAGEEGASVADPERADRVKGVLGETIEKNYRSLKLLLAQVYRHNLIKIARAARTRGTPLILCTVASNLADYDHPPSLRLRKNKGLRDEVERAERMIARREHAGALEVLAGAGREIFGEARITFLKARCLEELGRMDEARRLYEQANEEDFQSPNRAKASFNRIVADVAEQAGAIYVNVAGLFARQSPGGIVGENLFFDYCHLNARGHLLTAYVLGRAVIEAGLIGSGPELLARLDERFENFGLCDRALSPDTWYGHQILFDCPGAAIPPGRARYYQVGIALERFGHASEALAVYRWAADTLPPDPRDATLLGHTYHLNGLYGAARRYHALGDQGLGIRGQGSE